MENYNRFWSLLNKAVSGGYGCGMESDELKKSLVLEYTSGRTESLKEMTDLEYRLLCDALYEKVTNREALRKKRSVALKLMQGLGIDTLDWTRVNAFCEDRRIAGKAFYYLTEDELDAVAVKLRAIGSHGGLKPRAGARVIKLTIDN